MKVYVIGSLRNPNIPVVANELRKAGFDAFDDWYSVGPEADDKWQEYEKQRGRSYKEALQGAHAQDVFHFDKRNLDDSDAAVLVYPAGKSAHLELGYTAGKGKPTFILLDKEPERFDVMTLFATGVVGTVGELVEKLHGTNQQARWANWAKIVRGQLGPC